MSDCYQDEMVAELMSLLHTALDLATSWQTHDGCSHDLDTVEQVTKQFVEDYCQYHAGCSLDLETVEQITKQFAKDYCQYYTQRNGANL